MKPTLLVLAAGMGSRYGGVKQIDTVGLHNECLLDFAAYDAKLTGFDKIIYIIRKDIEKDFRERLFDRIAKNIDADYVFQSSDAIFTKDQLSKISATRTKPWGTMHAVLCAREKLNTPFAVINADDYYGREAFNILSEHLSKMDDKTTEHAMVGYILENTMSKIGSVSRGICTVEDGYLKSIVENTKIGYEEGKIISELETGKKTLTGNECVSMNCFGFGLTAFETFENYWNNFVSSSLESEKAEAYLPVAASQIVNDNKGKIKFYSSSEKWFGMTYPEDRELVKQEIANKIKENYYPETLWSY